MEKIVYVLGAGFSAPLGLPVMSNFLIKSKDLYFSNTEKFSHFQTVFETISWMAQGKNYFSSDLFNIEEILSILEMRERLGANSIRKDFITYIIDVIRHYTPPVESYPSQLPSNWHQFVFGKNKEMTGYGYFIASLLGLRIEEKQGNIQTLGRHFTLSKMANLQIEYSIITLNYDLVIENLLAYLKKGFPNSPPIDFEKEFFLNSTEQKFRLAKLHGSIDTEQIIPPTWNKGLGSEPIESWKLAYKYLALSGFPNVTCNRRGTGWAGISQGENIGKSWSGA